jgi:hypothetical protein
LTFGSGNVADPTVLSDGRILFVATQPPQSSNAASGPALFTINNDGTELTAFAQRQERGTRIERARELPDGRIVYLISKGETNLPGGAAEFVRLARPFQSRTPLLANAATHVSSVQPAGNGELLVCARDLSGAQASWALFRVASSATALGAPLLADPTWDCRDAVEAAPQRRPMGRLSSMDPTKATGLLLCLDVNRTSNSSTNGATARPTTHVRVIAETTPGIIHALGEVPVQADGSFMAEVPADVPLGFEALDGNGRVIRREAPLLWLRPGENRSCLGCHEPRNRSPHNQRPLAVSVPVPCLSPANAKLAQGNTN